MPDSLQHDLREVVVGIFATMFGEELRPARPMASDVGSVTGIVALTGACDGALLLRCESSLAQWIAQGMFAMGRPAQPAEMADAVGEMTNMAAGNMRAMLPQPCHFGLPVVAFGAGQGVNVIGASVQAHADLAGTAGRLSVTLLARRTAAPLPPEVH